MPIGAGGYVADTTILASGSVGSGDIQTGGVHSGNIASGQVGSVHLEDGTVVTVDLGSGSVVSGIIASGQIGRFHIASGQLAGFELGSGAIVSGRIASGQIGSFHHASGAKVDVSEWTYDDAFTAGEILSGASIPIGVAFTQSGTLQTAMASVSGRMPAVGIITANYASGATVTMIRGGRVYGTAFNFSGWMNQPVYVGRSGQLVASGAPTSSGDIQQVVGVSHQQSGMMVQLGDALEGVAAASGDVGSGAITGQAGGGYFCIASGTLGTYDHSSGTVVRAAQFVAPVHSGTAWSLVTEEAISGVRAVAISQSGNLWISMASVSGRMPAIGVVVDNVLSGIPANVYTQGLQFFTSGLFTGISHFGQPVWVGRSGQLSPISGSFDSGGWASGDIGQKLGVAVTQSGIAAFRSGAVLLNLNTTVWSGGPLGEATGGVI